MAAEATMSKRAIYSGEEREQQQQQQQHAHNYQEAAWVSDCNDAECGDAAERTVVASPKGGCSRSESRTAQAVAENDRRV